MVINIEEKVKKSLLMFHIATWGILLNKQKHINLVPLTPFIQYNTEEKLPKEQY